MTATHRTARSDQHRKPMGSKPQFLALDKRDITPSKIWHDREWKARAMRRLFDAIWKYRQIVINEKYDGLGLGHVIAPLAAGKLNRKFAPGP